MDKECRRCGQSFTYEKHESWWDYSGSDYDTRLARCKGCGEIIILEYIVDKNRERWYYEYG